MSDGSHSFLILPGLGNSGPDHWQSVWEAELPRARRIDLGLWDRPVGEAWVERAAAAIEDNPGAVLIGHSLGAVLVTLVAAARPDLDIGGALLVAPADVESSARTPDFLRAFAPIPDQPLPFPAVVVASRNDPYMNFARARDLAGAWGADLVDAGPAGHINVASGYGPWPEGRRLLGRLTPRRVPVLAEQQASRRV
ncbi:alpha/beta hydrolase [Oleomonas cavernae]|uniref:Alpha/beta hydrolase n=1 Tax=Oleomonas cavernae TaxID=2320859 RepID=A0A418WGE2_9PROT|nr:alpha/beta hydrolase [Oleomonas cavernae]RJF88969.1 alpha/beta hydrolase [Oleomonas cavernae]